MDSPWAERSDTALWLYTATKELSRLRFDATQVEIALWKGDFNLGICKFPLYVKV